MQNDYSRPKVFSAPEAWSIFTTTVVRLTYTSDLSFFNLNLAIAGIKRKSRIFSTVKILVDTETVGPIVKI